MDRRSPRSRPGDLATTGAPDEPDVARASCAEDNHIEADGSDDRGERDRESDFWPVFVGAAQLVKLIGILYQRPRCGDRPRELSTTGWRELPRQERSARRGLPMVCLVRPDGQDPLLSWLGEQLHRAQPDRVPHALIRLTEIEDGNPPGIDTGPLTAEDVEGVRTILREVTNELTRHANGHAGRFRFRLFSLLDWLMDREFSQDTVTRERALRKELRRQDISQRWVDALTSVGAALPGDPGWLRWPFAAARMLPQLIFLMAVTGRVPGLSSRYRWFLRQRYLSPEVTGGFVSFAGRLTRGQWIRENTEQVARLLISSFLEDLRRAYRWRPWQLWRVRRMTYVTLLLDNITRANGGYTTLRLINEVRNDVGRFDPLLVISASRKVPPDAGAIPGRPHYDAVYALEGYQYWQHSLYADRRARKVTAWYLPLHIPPGVPSNPERRQAEQQIGSFNGYQAGRAAAYGLGWSSGRMPRILVALILLSGLATGYCTWSYEHCDGGTSFPGFNPSLRQIGGECIGVTDGSYDIFQPSSSEIWQVENIIDQQNQKAKQLHAEQKDRPYITLVDMQALTSSTDNADGLTAERESLEGFAVAQSRLLEEPYGSTEPIVRVRIANAGKQMLQGVDVARQLSTLDTDDATIIGVVGLDMSSTPTVRTISALSGVGLPMVASALSADSLPDGHPMYFQVTPQNRREAAVAAAWAAQDLDAHPSIPHSVRVYYPNDATDTYSTNLLVDALRSFTDKGFQVEARAFTTTSDPDASGSSFRGDKLVGTAYAAGNDTCSYQGVVFFAGRGLLDYPDFLDGAGQCGAKAVFLGGDDVSRYVADPSERQEHQQPSFYYLSFASTPTAALQGPEQGFYADLYKLFSFEKAEKRQPSLDGHAALSYDAAKVFITAVTLLRARNGTIPITPSAVWREITEIHTSRDQQTNQFYQGVTGVIDFGGDNTHQVPPYKPVKILQVNNGEVDPALVGICKSPTDPDEPAWCPRDP